MQNHQKIDLPSLQDSPGLDTLACIEAAHRGDIDTALIMGGNLFQATPNESWAREAFDKIPMKFFLTTTLNRGHISELDNSETIILPVAARDEERQATTQESMFNYVRISYDGIHRLDNVRSEVDILENFVDFLLNQKTADGKAQKEFDFKVFKKHKNIQETIAASVPGMEKLKSIDVAKEKFHISRRLIHTSTFFTPSGKARFVKDPTSSTHNDEAFPYLLMNVRSEGQFNSIIYEENDSYRGIDQRWSVMMNTRQIRRLGIQEGHLVGIVSAFGKMDGVKVYSFDLPDGDLMAYYPEANRLIGLDKDPRSKTPAFKSVPVDILVDLNRLTYRNEL